MKGCSKANWTNACPVGHIPVRVTLCVSGTFTPGYVRQDENHTGFVLIKIFPSQAPI